MRRTRFFISIALFALTLSSCADLLSWFSKDKDSPEETALEHNISSAFFSIPSSFTGTSAKSVASDAWTEATVEAYFSTIRDQIRFGAAVAESMKSLLADLETVKIGEAYLLDSEIDLKHTTASGEKLRWDSLGSGHFTLEKWVAGGDKGFELDFTVSAGSTAGSSIYRGSILADVAALGWSSGVSGSKNPDWVKAEFDSDKGGAGTQWLKISLEGFRYHADLETAVENAIIEVSRAADGTVSLGSVISVPNSRHFVWNGYLKQSTGGEALNTAATAETRYYSAAGVANAANKATVYLGIPTAIDSTVFSNNSIGTLLKQLFTDRLNNDYDFSGKSTSGENGHAIIANINNYLTTAGQTSYVLDETTYSNNTADDVYAAVQETYDLLYRSGLQNDYVEYLLSVMAVVNPCYFLEASYDSYGATVPVGYSTIASPEVLLPAQTSVDSMDLGFAMGLEPGF